VGDGFDTSTQNIFVTTANTASSVSAGSAVNTTVGSGILGSLAGITVIDPDSNDVISATINAPSGVNLALSGSNNTGATLNTISANQIKVTGTTSQVNAAIDQLVASSNTAGSVTLSITVSDSVSSTSTNLTLNVTPNAPGAPSAISAISSGISSAEFTSGFDLTVSLVGTGAKVGDTLKIYGRNQGSSDIVLAQKTLTSSDLSATQISVIPTSLSSSNLTSLGVDGNKLLSASLTSGGLESPLSSAITVNLDRTAPVITSPASASAIDENSGA
jgi:hypothetical protein